MKAIKLLAITLLAFFSFNMAGAQQQHARKNHAHARAHHKRVVHHRRHQAIRRHRRAQRHREVRP